MPVRLGTAARAAVVTPGSRLARRPSRVTFRRFPLAGDAWIRWSRGTRPAWAAATMRLSLATGWTQRISRGTACRWRPSGRGARAGGLRSPSPRPSRWPRPAPSRHPAGTAAGAALCAGRCTRARPGDHGAADLPPPGRGGGRPIRRPALLSLTRLRLPARWPSAGLPRRSSRATASATRAGSRAVPARRRRPPQIPALRAGRAVPRAGARHRPRPTCRPLRSWPALVPAAAWAGIAQRARGEAALQATARRR